MDAVRAALSRLFSAFVLHPQQNPRYEGTGRAELVDVAEDYMIELEVRPQALLSYGDEDDVILPVLRREPLNQAESKERIGFATAHEGPPVLDEDAPLDTAADDAWGEVARAVAALEQRVAGAGGTVLRYGGFYGPGMVYDSGGTLEALARKRRLPVCRGRHGNHLVRARRRHRRRGAGAARRPARDLQHRGDDSARASE